jgi:catalase
MHLPVNAPRCPFNTLQQDGHMALYNPKSRVNYEPNSWGGAAGGPRESPEHGFHSYPAEDSGSKLRVRAELFADHYSQARQFYRSQTPVEQTHIKDAFVFELSKVETPKIRARMVANLLNVDQDLAKQVADGLGLKEMPKAADPARPVLNNLPPSPALSIIRNGPTSFKGRKVGVLLTDGADAALFSALRLALEAEGAMLEVVAPRIGGVTASDGTAIPAKQKINGGPSVLYDAVALLPSAQGVALLAKEATARDFVWDAFAHTKFIAFAEPARQLFEKIGMTEHLDAGFIAVGTPGDATRFVETCRKLRFWEREPQVHAA